MYNPLVSIIIPVYCGEKYMRVAIDSAINQTYKNIEIIVVNDGSNDNGATKKIADSYGDRIRYFEKENGGCASALNYGIQVMRGEWFSWLSHDDVYKENKIERQIAAIRNKKLNPETTIVSCNAELIDENGNLIKHPMESDNGIYNNINFFKRIIFNQSLNGCGLLIPTCVIKKVGLFSQSYKYVLDFEYWLRISLENFQLYRMGKEALVQNRVHSQQVTVSCSNIQAKECEQVIEQITGTVLENKLKDYADILLIYSLERGFMDNSKRIMNIYKNKGESFRKLLFIGKIKHFAYVVLEKIKNLYWKLRR